MKKLPFGYQWWGVSLLSLVLFELYLGSLRSMITYMDTAGQVFALGANQFTYFLVGLVVYHYLGKTLYVRSTKFIYWIYLCGGVALIILSTLRAVDLYDSGANVPIASVRNALIFQTGLPFVLAFVWPWFIYWRRVWAEGLSHRRIFNAGQGGSSIWAGVGTFRKRPSRLKQNVLSLSSSEDEGVKTDRIILGRSLYDDTPFPSLIALKDKSHYIYIASTRSGKSVSQIYTIAATNTSNMIFVDMKGELVNATARRRGSPAALQKIGITSDNTTKHFKYGEVAVFDPFGSSGIRSTKFNPMQYCDVNDPACSEYINAIVDGCVMSEDKKNAYFEEVPRIILKGFIVYVLLKFPKECHNLPFVVGLMVGKNPQGFLDPEYATETLIDMLTMGSEFGGAAAMAAKDLLESGENQKGALMSSLMRSVKWITEPGMSEHLTGESEFDFRDIGMKTVTDEQGRVHKVIHSVYLILSDTRMKEFNRYLRTALAISTVALQNRTPISSADNCLFIIDEMPKLGHMKFLGEGFSFLASYKIQFMVFLQALGQLKGLYPKLWSSMIGNSNSVYFGINDLDTAKFISESLGQHQKKRTKNEGTILDAATIKNETNVDLLTPAEIMTLLSKGSKLMILLPADGFPMRLERLTFRPMQIVEDGRTFNTIGLNALKNHFEDY